MSIALWFFTFLLVLVALFLILVVLAQKAKSDGGMGAAMGGGMAEAAFGAETSNVLSRSTIYASIIFFVLTFGLYLGRIYERKQAAHAAGSALPDIVAPATPVSAPSTIPLTVPAAPSVTTPAPSSSMTPAAPTPAAPAKQP
jgi:preprotein translocase subunit SecG